MDRAHSARKMNTIGLAAGAALLAAACGSALGVDGTTVDGVLLDSGVYLSANDHEFTYEKREGEYGPVTTWFKDGVTYDFDGVMAFDAAHPRARIDANELAEIEKLPKGATVKLSVELRTNPWTAVSRAAWRARADLIAARVAEIRELQRSMFPDRVLSEAEEHAWAEGMAARKAALPAASQARIDAIKFEMDLLGDQVRDEAVRAVGPMIEPEQRAVADVVRSLGGKVHGGVMVVSGLEIELPAGRVAELLKDERVVRVSIAREGEPELNVTVPSLGVNLWHDAGIRGGVWDGALLDTGCQVNHPAFQSTGLMFLQAPGVGGVDSNGHGTSVTGIITSRDATRMGLAPGIDHYLVGLAGGTNTRLHGNWMVSTAAQVPEMINISFSIGSTTTGYHDNEKWFDALIDSSNCIVAKSTGNAGSGAQSITQPGQAYNLMGSANMTFFGTVSRADDKITQSSSRGPTKDGRKKPDISSPGEGVFSCNSAWATGEDFDGFGGTSAASPHTGASYLLVTDLRGAPEPIAGKAVLLNAADAMSDGGTLSSSTDDGPIAGSHWSPTYGWGYNDMTEALVNGADVFVDELDLDAESDLPKARFFAGHMLTNEKATLVWNRHLVYQTIGTPFFVRALTDLDLRAFSPDGTQLAASATVTNNVEQLSVGEDADVVLSVTIAGNTMDPAIVSQRFALATEELFEEIDGPKLRVEGQHGPLIRGRVCSMRAVCFADGGLPNQSVNASISFQALVAIDPASGPVGTVSVGDGGTFAQRVRIPASHPGPVSVTVFATSSSFGVAESVQDRQDVPILCPGEYNGLGPVDLADLIEFLLFWQAETGLNGPALESDFNGDNNVDLGDLVGFLDTWSPAIGSDCTP